MSVRLVMSGRSVVAATLLSAACSQAPSAPPPAVAIDAAQAADTIYTGGDIVTVNDAQPSAEAVAVKDGRIVAVGTRAEVERSRRGSATTVIDLGGRTLTPGFIDGHAHVAAFGLQAVGANLLAPPDGGVSTVDELVAAMQAFAASDDVKRTGWVIGSGYDDAILGRHPNRDDLDKVSTTLPVIAIHISAHFSALNSVALKMVGYSAATKDPEGGVIRRRPGSREPLGVQEEAAHFAYLGQATTPKTPEDGAYFMRRGIELAKSHGQTTVNEGRASKAHHEALLRSSVAGLFDIDVMSYVDYTDAAIIPGAYSRTYRNRYRVAGMKITLDGSPQGRTGWRSIPYLLPPDGQKPGYKGYPVIPDTKVVENALDLAYENGWPTKVHANGDAAIDQMIAALAPVHARYGPGDRRHVLIHGQFVTRAQLEKLNALQVIPSLFPMHTFYWGDWYDRIIGPEAAQAISPMRTAIDLGMRPTSHSDAPVALPNLLQVMWATVNRTSRSGKVMGAGERVTPLEALEAITIWGARQHFEEKDKGSIEVGKLADFAILSANPLAVDPQTINTITVLETIKEGKRVYKRQ